MPAHGKKTVQTTVRNRRVGEHGRENGDESHTDAEFHHRVGLSAEVEIDLNRRRLLHHPMAERTDLLHVRSHKAVAGFGNPLDVVEGTDRLHAKVEKCQIEFVSYRQEVFEIVL